MPVLGPVATALPDHLPQARLREVAAAMVGEQAMLRVFESARVEHRALAMPLEWYMEPHGFQDRNDAYLQAGLPLAQEAARGALAAAGITAQDLTGILFVSTTGMATPSLDARLAASLGCRPDVRRVPAWGWGCAGGVAAVNRAAEMVGDGHMLVVCLELCSLQFDPARAFRSDAEGKKSVVAASLFSDGCAALVVSGTGEGLEHVRGTSHLFPGSERVMGWDVKDDHLEVVLSPEIPLIVEQELPRVLLPWLRDLAATRAGTVALPAGGSAPHAVQANGAAGATMTQGVPRDSVDHWILHPGGARVVDAFCTGLGLRPRDVEATRRVLAQHGNMSSPTVLAVLQERMREPGIRSGESALMAALGPGFALEMCLLRAP